MRSRTEMVTTTFIDSEEDQTETEDSEEDWRPDSSRTGKRRPSKSGKSRQNKRKANSSGASGNRKMKKHDQEQFKETSASDDDDFEKEYAMHSRDEQKALSHNFNMEKDELVKSDAFNLYLYKKDLDKDYKENSHLCLWRRDGTNLLQKYIRVKTNNIEDFVFTSSSVYSSWDHKRRKEFATIHVKCMEENNRRVTLLDPTDLNVLADKEASRKNRFSAQEPKTYEESSNEKSESQEDEDDDEEEEEEEEDDSYEEQSGIENEAEEEDDAQSTQSDN